MLLEDPTVTEVRRDWVGHEAEVPGVRAELRRLGRRARRRPWRTLAWALGCAALAVVATIERPPTYVSRVSFRVSGGGSEPARAARTLRDWIVASVLSDGQLRALIDEHGLYPTLAARDPRRAVELLRDDLTVELARVGWSAQRLDLTLRGDDADKVYDAVAHVGRLVGEARVHAHPPRRALGLRLTLVDGGRRDARLAGRAVVAVLAGVFGFLLALPLCAVAVGAFDPRVYDLDDVSRLGMATVGAIRRFEGDNAGALVARLGHARISPS
ncbi:MAG TPA: hypothetical protein VGL86_08585 [Polyangia bacterium]